jgi:molybdopterin-guanine dinucleotide biosynthesis protein A
MSKAVAGLALAGGRSSRFGREKAAEPVAGRPMLDWCVAALAAHCDRVAVSAAAGSQAEALAREWGLSVLLDDSGYAPGPLRGILAGLAWAAADGRDWLLTLPCDTPRIGADEVARLLAETGDAPAAQAHTSEGPQGLCAVWRTNLAGEVEAGRARVGPPPGRRRRSPASATRLFTGCWRAWARGRSCSKTPPCSPTSTLRANCRHWSKRRPDAIVWSEVICSRFISLRVFLSPNQFPLGSEAR